MKKSALKFHGTVKDGRFTPEHIDAFKSHVRSFEGKSVAVTVKKKRNMKDRSNNENRYYWGVVVKILADEWGYQDHEKVHEILKYQFLSSPVEVKGKLLVETRGTKNLSTSDFETFMSEIRKWASLEFGIHIPLPNEVPFNY